MSDTPRTDAFDKVCGSSVPQDAIDFARQIERELATLRRKVTAAEEMARFLDEMFLNQTDHMRRKAILAAWREANQP